MLFSIKKECGVIVCDRKRDSWLWRCVVSVIGCMMTLPSFGVVIEHHVVPTHCGDGSEANVHVLVNYGKKILKMNGVHYYLALKL